MASSRSDVIGVSVVTPAYNAAATIADTLDSLCRQVYPHWEVIVVDDGSNDGTGDVVRRFLDREPRIRLLRQDNRGLSAARNIGVALAGHEWLLFLDADDWISPLYLQTLTAELTANPQLDAVHCLSARVASDGTHIVWNELPPSGDMFSTLSNRPAFAIHACIVRKSLVKGVGQFDTSLRHCADWDLWQRIARTGARFGAVRDVLAYYRMQQNSLSLNAESMVRDALRILRQGHCADPRVQNPHPAHADGSPFDEVSSQAFYLVCWSAGVLLGHCEDPRPLLDQIRDYTYANLSPDGVAECIFESAILPSCQPLRAWEYIWPRIEGRVDSFLVALEEHSRTTGLAKLAHKCLRRRIVEHLLSLRPPAEMNEHDEMSTRRALVAELDELEDDFAKDGWWLRVGSGNSATLKIAPCGGDSARVVIARASSTNSYDIQLNRRLFQARAHARLAIVFQARADRARSIFVGFSQAHEPWASLGLYRRVDLTPEWHGFQQEFVAVADDDDARIHFDLGDSDIAVDVASVSLLSLDSDANDA